MTALHLAGVDKFYGENHVLDNVDLDVESGELVVIVGPSGCGKSTLLRVIAGLETPSNGIIEIDGKPANDVPPALRDIAMVFQAYALYPHLTVFENLRFSLKIAGLSHDDIRKRIDEVSRILALEDYLDRKPSELSGGQRQRVALGRALVRKPKIFLFDEPLSNLDAALRMNTRIEIAEIHRTFGATIIYVTHDQTEAMTLADKIVVMCEGRIEQVGAPLELYNEPSNTFVAGFIGSPAMNFIHDNIDGLPNVACIGLRPEHLRIVDNGRLTGQVLHFERLGTDTHVIVDRGGDQLMTIRVVGQIEFALGTTLQFEFDNENAHLFDDTGMRIVTYGGDGSNPKASLAKPAKTQNPLTTERK